MDNHNAKTVCFFNNKGGIGKTTLALGLAGALAQMRGKKVLLIDMDDQCNSSSACGLLSYCKGYQKNIRGLLRLGDDISDAITVDFDDVIFDTKGLFQIIPGSRDLVSAWSVLSPGESEEYRRVFSGFVDLLREYYDYIIFDVKPSFIGPAHAVLCITDYHIIPISSESSGFSLDGASETMQQCRDECIPYNKNYKMVGFVQTCYENGRNSSQIIKTEKIPALCEKFGVRQFSTTIPRAEVIGTCMANGESFMDPYVKIGRTKPIREKFFSFMNEFLNYTADE